MIYIYDLARECFDDMENVFLIDKPSSVANPYTEIPKSGLSSKYLCETHEEAIERYEHYFDVMYDGNKRFRQAIDRLYDIYKRGEDIYLACADRGERCHGDVIKEKIQQMLLKEKLNKKKDNETDKTEEVLA